MVFPHFASAEKLVIMNKRQAKVIKEKSRFDKYLRKCFLKKKFLIFLV